MYIRKDIHKSLRLEAEMADGSHCFSWAKLFRECSHLLRRKDREIKRLRQSLEHYEEYLMEKADKDLVKKVLEMNAIDRAALKEVNE